MEKAVKLILVLAVVSLLIGIFSRITMTPIPPGATGLEANAFLRFTNTCLIAAILMVLLEKKAK